MINIFLKVQELDATVTIKSILNSITRLEVSKNIWNSSQNFLTFLTPGLRFFLTCKNMELYLAVSAITPGSHRRISSNSIVQYWGLFHKSWAHGTNHRDSSISLHSASVKSFSKFWCKVQNSFWNWPLMLLG